MAMQIAVLKETDQGERRVAAVPQTVRRFVGRGWAVKVQSGAGLGSSIADEQFAQAGATIAPDARAALEGANLVLMVRPPARDEASGMDVVDLLGEGVTLVGILNPLADPQLIGRLASRGVTSFSLDLLPRITRAQTMDVLSSMATLAGYRAVLLAAGAMRKMAPLMMTAAGTLQPAHALVIGAGVAGLQAIATARRLGAVVKGVDTRPVVREQVESLGARFVPLEVQHEQAQDEGGYARDLGEEFYRQEQQVLAPHVREADFIITTAMIPRRRAPLLITRAMVESMKGGSVIVDLAAPAGGNCVLTQPGRDVVHADVTIMGPLNLPNDLPVHASLMVANNLAAFLEELVKDRQVNPDPDNEILTGTLITHLGQVRHAVVLGAMSASKESS